MLVLDKTNQIKEVQPFETYLIPNPDSTRLQYYNDVVSVLYTGCFTDFSSKERFQHYLIAEGRWRFEIESDINSGADPGEVKWVNFHPPPPFSDPPSFFIFSDPSNIDIIFDFSD